MRQSLRLSSKCEDHFFNSVRIKSSDFRAKRNKKVIDSNHFLRHASSKMAPHPREEFHLSPFVYLFYRCLIGF